MKIDLTLIPSGDYSRDAQLIRRAEKLGMDAVWTADAGHNPFFSLTLAAANTSSINLGTQVAFRIPAQPMVTAQIAWDLARQSGGRFILGLGTEPSERMEGLSVADRADPVARMREYIESMRAIWDSFQTDARLRYRGEYYQFRLMAPFFNPGPIPHPDIPIFLAAESPSFCELAGELCQGLHTGPLHRTDLLRQSVLPSLMAGLKASKRQRSGFVISASPLAVTGLTDEARRRSMRRAKRQIAFEICSQASQYLVQQLGWSSVAEELIGLAGQRRWGEMPALIGDEIIHEIAVVAEPIDLLRQITDRYEGLADRISLVMSGADSALIESILQGRV